MQNWIYLFQNDDTFRKKVLFFVGVGLTMVLLVTFIVWINTRDNTRIVSNNGGSDTQVATEFERDYRLVTERDFAEGQGLTEIFSQPIQQANALTSITGNRWVSLTDTFTLSINGEEIPFSPVFTPESIYNTSNGIIINEQRRSTVYTGGTFTQYPEGIHSVVPGFATDPSGNRSVPVYLFVQQTGNVMEIKQAADIQLTRAVTILNTFTLSSEAQFGEITVINRNPYLFIYSTLVKQDTVNIWYLDPQNRFQNIFNIRDVISFTIHDRGLIYTAISENPNELSLYDNYVISMETRPEGEEFEISLETRMARDEIFGSLLAHRCDLAAEDTLVCLVKQNRVLHTQSDEPDKLISYNYRNDEYTVLFESLIYSAEVVRYTQPNNFYIIGQENRLLYGFQP